MYFSADQIQQLNVALGEAHERYVDMIFSIAELCSRLSSDSAKEFLLHGAGRRLKVIDHCIKDIFKIYPPTRTEVLSDEELTQVSVNLHAFFVNLFGIQDNLAWTVAYEKNLPQLNNRFQIGLYRRERMPDGTQEQVANSAMLTPEFTDYLNTAQLKTWQNEHLKEFRDALAHRIPMYIVPYAQTDAGMIIQPFPCYAGSVFDGRGLVMHAQLLADFNTVSEMMDKCFEFEFPAVATFVGA